MKNEKVIIVNGIQRGGTNIVWNLLQSHPDIVSPIRETGELIYPLWMSQGPSKLFRKPMRALLHRGFGPLIRNVDKNLYKQKMLTLNDSDNKYKNEYDIYTEQEIEAAALTTKSVGDDIFFTPTLANWFTESYVISVVRNGLATCEGWIRRGISPEKAAKTYKKIMQEILRQEAIVTNHRFVKFEDCLEDPVIQATMMYQFVDVESEKLKKLRIKAKSIVQKDGSYHAPFSMNGKKVWLDKENARDFYDCSITERQINNLSREEKSVILKEIGPIMEELGYSF